LTFQNPLKLGENVSANLLEIGINPAQKSLKAHMSLLVRPGVKKAAFQKT
jgi:hypothetical protein